MVSKKQKQVAITKANYDYMKFWGTPVVAGITAVFAFDYPMPIKKILLAAIILYTLGWAFVLHSVFKQYQKALMDQ